MLNNLTTEEKYVLGGTALLLGAIAFVKPVRKTIGLSDNRKRQNKKEKEEYSIKWYQANIDEYAYTSKNFSKREAIKLKKKFKNNNPSQTFEIVKSGE